MHKRILKRLIKLQALSVLILILLIPNLQSQTIRRVMVLHSPPPFTFQFNLHYNEGIGQMGGTYNADFQSEDFINGRTFGATKGFGFDIVTKYQLDDMGHFRITASGIFNRMNSYLFKSKTTIADRGNSRFDIYSFGAGFENNFTPNHKIKLFLGIQPVLSIIKGSANLYAFNPERTPNHQQLDSIYSISIKTGIRIGASLTGGFEYVLNDQIGINIGFNLLYANLLLKSAEDSGDPYHINLVDNDNSAMQMYAGRKNIIVMSMTAGISFYWGVDTKRYVLSP
jgi:hypothetical protein